MLYPFQKARWTKTLRERFDDKWIPEPNTGCWLWTAATDGCGYGQIHVKKKANEKRKMKKAHRLSWYFAFGNIPDGLLVCHRCNTPQCVNPAHLYLGTNQENLMDAARDGLLWTTRVTHCPAGHEYTKQNTRHRKSLNGRLRRTCRKCEKIYRDGGPVNE